MGLLKALIAKREEQRRIEAETAEVEAGKIRKDRDQ